MTRYHLAKLVAWAGCLKQRKRLQKVVFLLQASGCPLDTDFSLHHYGPYSEDLARLTDEMVRQSLLSEQAEDNSRGKQYSYRLAPDVQQQILDLEATEQGKIWQTKLAPFEKMAQEFFKEDLKKLEYASTIVFFRTRGSDWDEAVEKAVAFKKTELVKDALPLAKRVVA